MKNIFAVLLIIWLSLSAGLVVAADLAAGKAKAATCAGCHGANGISNNPLWPNLAGQKAAYLAKQIRAFKAGERKDPTMEPMAKPLSDADIENISAYFESLKQSQ
jgi:cytochrome c553